MSFLAFIAWALLLPAAAQQQPAPSPETVKLQKQLDSMASQHHGNVAFRDPVPAYKHSSAIFLNMTGRIPSNRSHPSSLIRPEWEAHMLRDCARRLGYDL